MLRDAIDKLAELGKASIEPHLVPHSSRKSLLVTGAGHEFIDIPTPDRAHTVRSVDGLLEAADVWGTKGVLWHSHDRAVLVVDDADRREVVTLPLVQSDKFVSIVKLEKSGPLSQRDLVRLLKHDLSGCVSDTLLPAIRRIDFNRKNSGVDDLQHGKESLGRSVEVAVSGADAVPEYASATVPVYQTPGLQMVSTIRLSLDIQVDDQRFRLAPLPDEVADAIDNTHASLHDRLKESGLSVFYGTP